jgi:hypothetical protein
MRWAPVAVLAAVAPWLGVVGDFAEGPAGAASGTAGPVELAKRNFIRGGRDEYSSEPDIHEAEAGYVASTVCIAKQCCPCSAEQLAALAPDGLGKRFPSHNAHHDAGDAVVGIRVPADDERGRDSRALLQSGSFTMVANIKPGPGVSFSDVRMGHIDAGCGAENQKCNCEMQDGVAHMSGKGTDGSATGLIISCDMYVSGATGGQGQACSWELKMPYIGDNSYTYHCDGFYFVVVSGFHKSGTTNNDISVEVVKL